MLDKGTRWLTQFEPILGMPAQFRSPPTLRQHGVPLAGLQPCSVRCEPVSTGEAKQADVRPGGGWGGETLWGQENGEGRPDPTVAGCLQGTDNLSSWAAQWWPCFAQGSVVREKHTEGLRGGGIRGAMGTAAWEVISLLFSTLGTVPASHPLLVLYLGTDLLRPIKTGNHAARLQEGHK